jgi:ring-1,2-phenylacetyl-CoA epoxidase subunit PaaD
VTVATTPDLDEVRHAVAGVPDPELPPVTVGMLGMIHDVAVSYDGEVSVEMLPTISGCPAIDMIAADVRAAVGAVPGVTAVRVQWRYDPPWTTDRISEEGHRALASFGIAPPLGSGEVTDLSGAKPRLPLLGGPSAGVGCPYCDSTDTVKESTFGPTPCRAIHYCNACRQPFEAFKDV